MIELDRLAKRACLERGDPNEWDGGAETANAAEILALQLLEGWIKCKAINGYRESAHSKQCYSTSGG